MPSHFSSSRRAQSLDEEETTDKEFQEKTPEEVIKDLEAALSATVEELEQQRRLNQSLNKRKVIIQKNNSSIIIIILPIITTEFQRSSDSLFASKASSQMCAVHRKGSRQG